MNALNATFKKIYTWLLPYQCILCLKPSDRKQDLCSDCLQDLPTISHACPRCARVLFGTHATCGSCIINEPPFNTTYALFLYEKPISNLILNLKFQERLVNARILGELFANKICTHWYKDKPLPEVIIPMPLHTQRLKERGFNQALEIARPIAHQLCLPLDVMSYGRQRATLPQAQLPLKERKQNIKKAFLKENPHHYRHIAVFDDVITTGQTIREFCKTIKKDGVEQIDVWCIARPSFSESGVYNPKP
jgi:ComF family protein